jgi:hypothetical protein
VAEPVVTLINLVEGLKKKFSVLVVLEDGPSGIAPGGYVVNSAVVLYPERSRHINKLP